jgi:hypothetical protein
LLDDIFLSPVKFLHFIAKAVREEAMKDFLDERGARKELRELYRLLESGKISESEFESREKILIDRLEQIEAYKSRKSASAK